MTGRMILVRSRPYSLLPHPPHQNGKTFSTTTPAFGYYSIRSDSIPSLPPSSLRDEGRSPINICYVGTQDVVWKELIGARRMCGRRMVCHAVCGAGGASCTYFSGSRKVMETVWVKDQARRGSGVGGGGFSISRSFLEYATYSISALDCAALPNSVDVAQF